jgi:hypothetical protein
LVGADSIYVGDDRVGATVRRAERDAQEWISAGRTGAAPTE